MLWICSKYDLYQLSKQRNSEQINERITMQATGLQFEGNELSQFMREIVSVGQQAKEFRLIMNNVTIINGDLPKELLKLSEIPLDKMSLSLSAKKIKYNSKTEIDIIILLILIFRDLSNAKFQKMQSNKEQIIPKQIPKEKKKKRNGKYYFDRNEEIEEEKEGNHHNIDNDVTFIQAQNEIIKDELILEFNKGVNLMISKDSCNLQVEIQEKQGENNFILLIESISKLLLALSQFSFSDITIILQIGTFKDLACFKSKFIFLFEMLSQISQRAKHVKYFLDISPDSILPYSSLMINHSALTYEEINFGFYQFQNLEQCLSLSNNIQNSGSVFLIQNQNKPVMQILNNELILNFKNAYCPKSNVQTFSKSLSDIMEKWQLENLKILNLNFPIQLVRSEQIWDKLLLIMQSNKNLHQINITFEIYGSWRNFNHFQPQAEKDEEIIAINLLLALNHSFLENIIELNITFNLEIYNPIQNRLNTSSAIAPLMSVFTKMKHIQSAILKAKDESLILSKDQLFIELNLADINDTQRVFQALSQDQLKIENKFHLKAKLYRLVGNTKVFESCMNDICSSILSIKIDILAMIQFDVVLDLKEEMKRSRFFQITIENQVLFEKTGMEYAEITLIESISNPLNFGLNWSLQSQEAEELLLLNSINSVRNEENIIPFKKTDNPNQLEEEEKQDKIVGEEEEEDKNQNDDEEEIRCEQIERFKNGKIKKNTHKKKAQKTSSLITNQIRLSQLIQKGQYEKLGALLKEIQERDRCLIKLSFYAKRFWIWYFLNCPKFNKHISLVLEGLNGMNLEGKWLTKNFLTRVGMELEDFNLTIKNDKICFNWINPLFQSFHKLPELKRLSFHIVNSSLIEKTISQFTQKICKLKQLQELEFSIESTRIRYKQIKNMTKLLSKLSQSSSLQSLSLIFKDTNLRGQILEDNSQPIKNILPANLTTLIFTSDSRNQGNCELMNSLLYSFNCSHQLKQLTLKISFPENYFTFLLAFFSIELPNLKFLNLCITNQITDFLEKYYEDFDQLLPLMKFNQYEEFDIQIFGFTIFSQDSIIFIDTVTFLQDINKLPHSLRLQTQLSVARALMGLSPRWKLDESNVETVSLQIMK